MIRYKISASGAHENDEGVWVMYEAAQAEITQLRAELAQERELADRLASGADNVDYMERPHSLDDALADWRTRRNK